MSLLSYLLLGSGLSTLSGIAWAFIERARKTAYLKEANLWKERGIFAEERERSNAEKFQAEINSLERVITVLKSELLMLEREVAQCMDPKLIRNRLVGMFNRAQTNPATVTQMLKKPSADDDSNKGGRSG